MDKDSSAGKWEARQPQHCVSLEQEHAGIQDLSHTPPLNCQALGVQGETRNRLGGGNDGVTGGSRVISGLVSEGEKN